MMYINQAGIYRGQGWHIGQPMPVINSRVVTFQCDGDELDVVLAAIKAASSKSLAEQEIAADRRFDEKNHRLLSKDPKADIDLAAKEMPQFKNATCGGCYVLGTACRRCERCAWERTSIAGCYAGIQFEDGFHAKLNGAMRLDNPYASGTSESDAWKWGYDHAK